jgi:hypothetical protein
VCKTIGFDRGFGAGMRMSMFVALAMVVACGRAPLEDPGSDPGLAQVVLALDAAPADVSCVVITASTDHADRRTYPVTPGATTTFTLPRLPVGLVVFAVDGLAAACAALDATSVATWQGGPVSAVLHAGANEPIAIVMRRNGVVKVSLDFPGGPAPVCAAEGAACVNNGDCCMNRCVVDVAGGGIGLCQAASAPPPPPGPSVDLAFAGDKSYLFYPVDGAPNCGSDTTLSVQVSEEQQSVCVSPSVGDVIPVLVEQVSLCAAGGTCDACGDDSCRPASCFPPAPLAPAPGPCAHTLVAVPGQLVTRYLLLRRIDVHNPPARPDGLPRLFAASGTGATVTITPPESQPDFAVARLGRPLVSPGNTGGEMCGGLSLCGIVPFQGFGGSLFGSWFFTALGTNLFSSPLF